MYSLLIVDDEKIIRDGLFELFSMEEKLELNIFVGASAIEAERILEQRKIDIVLTDIQMPEMSGIELMDLIIERWPHCKVIFLTGFSKFDYVYKVHKHARYVLKAEDDRKIIEAVTEAIEEIENDFMIERIVEDTGLLKKQQKEQEKARFLWDLFNGFVNTSSITQELFTDLEINLDITGKIFYLIIRHEYIIKESYNEQLKIIEDMQLLVDKYFFYFMEGISINCTKNFMVLLLQPKKLVTIERNIMALKGNSELFQKACMKNFNMAVAIAIGGRPVKLEEVLGSFQTVKAKLLMSSEDNLMVVDESLVEELDGDYFIEQQKNIIKSRLQLLDYYFENSNREHVIALIREAMNLFGNTASIHNLFAVEVYSDIAVKLIKYINRFKLSKEICFKINVYNLYNVTLHNSWSEAFNYLINITEFIFELKMANLKKQNDDVVNRVKKYIHENLRGDTSLDTLGDLVGLSPEYLLRLFKKSENVTVLQYINELKIIKAKNLITNHNLLIKEIATELGFTSSGYFSRFFKSKTGLSPQAYRDKLE